MSIERPENELEIQQLEDMEAPVYMGPFTPISIWSVTLPFSIALT